MDVCNANEVRYRRHLPHFQRSECWYHVTFSLQLGLVLPPEACKIVLTACLYQDGKLWDVAACAAMPTLGTHVLAAPRTKADEGLQHLEKILHDAKGWSGYQINKLFGRSGFVWERESFDRQIRSEADFRTVVSYIANNPVKAGLAASPMEYPALYLHPDVRMVFEETEALLRGVSY